MKQSPASIGTPAPTTFHDPRFHSTVNKPFEWHRRDTDQCGALRYRRFPDSSARRVLPPRLAGPQGLDPQAAIGTLPGIERGQSAGVIGSAFPRTKHERRATPLGQGNNLWSKTAVPPARARMLGFHDLNRIAVLPKGPDGNGRPAMSRPPYCSMNGKSTDLQWPNAGAGSSRFRYS